MIIDIKGQKTDKPMHIIIEKSVGEPFRFTIVTDRNEELPSNISEIKTLLFQAMDKLPSSIIHIPKVRLGGKE